MLINNIWIGSRITLYRCETTTKPHVIGLKQHTVYKCYNDYTNNTIVTKKKKILTALKQSKLSDERTIISVLSKLRTRRYTFTGDTHERPSWTAMNIAQPLHVYIDQRHSRAAILDCHEHRKAFTHAHRIHAIIMHIK